ncbi:MAG: hypothetical protein HQ402_02190 [Parcubacteria group bacterium]|nr:hypothetical protein [Parcubacteria group bacterium]
MKTITPRKGESFLDLLARCDGYYACPKGPKGERLGPLVGYAGRDDQGRQFVGDVYVNFAMAERYGWVLEHCAKHIPLEATNRGLYRTITRGTGFCGAPEGGKALATAMTIIFGKQYIFPEKKITAVATDSSREVSELVFSRHEPYKGDVWWIVEDVCNNFSTTAKLVELIESVGASVAGILCFLNRSLLVGGMFSPRCGLDLPVISLVRKPIEQYDQDDPEVVDDIKAGNVVWKPKNEWGRLAQAMADHSSK